MLLCCCAAPHKLEHSKFGLKCGYKSLLIYAATHPKRRRQHPACTLTMGADGSLIKHASITTQALVI
jgi:hypothetical protein